MLWSKPSHNPLSVFLTFQFFTGIDFISTVYIFQEVGHKVMFTTITLCPAPVLLPGLQLQKRIHSCLFIFPQMSVNTIIIRRKHGLRIKICLKTGKKSCYSTFMSNSSTCRYDNSGLYASSCGNTLQAGYVETCKIVVV